MGPDFESVKQYAFSRLENELAPYLIYHNLAHTRDDVLPAATRLAVLTGLHGESLLLLQTAAVYHDLGFIEQASGHEAVSVRIAIETLPRFGYNRAQIQVVADIIVATRLPQTPKDLLGELLADADLDVLGREDFLEAELRLRLELAAQGIHLTDEEWYIDQLDFLESHSYFTAAARFLRAGKKQENIERLKALLKCFSFGSYN